MQERLQKVIARSGVVSRRKAEELIRRGEVFVDGKRVTVLGTRIDPEKNRVVVSGKPLRVDRQRIFLLFHKPRKCLVTKFDPEGRKTVYDLIPEKYAHLKPVGRLDYDSEGLILLTNDGEAAHRMAHPRNELNKVYEVKVTPRPGPRQLQRLKGGMVLDGRKTRPAEVEILRENPKSTWLKMTLHEGRNRQIRRMCEKVNLTVKTLIRKEIGPFKITGLEVGGWYEVPGEGVVSNLLK